MKALILAAASTLALLVPLSFADAQTAPETQPSTSMQRDGGPSTMRTHRTVDAPTETPSTTAPTGGPGGAAPSSSDPGSYTMHQNTKGGE